MQWLRDIAAVFRPPTAATMALRELEDAKRRLLGAHAALEYAEGMVGCHTKTVARLTKTLATGLSK